MYKINCEKMQADCTGGKPKKYRDFGFYFSIVGAFTRPKNNIESISVLLNIAMSVLVHPPPLGLQCTSYFKSYVCIMWTEAVNKGPSIKYVTLFLANFNLLPSVTHPGTRPQKYVTHLGPPIFSRSTL